MEKSLRPDKDARRAAMAERLRHDPGLTDQALAAAFGVSVATVRLDRRTLGIPQLRDRLEAAAHAAASGGKCPGLEMLELFVGVRALALFPVTKEAVDASGVVPAEKLYGISVAAAEAVAGAAGPHAQVGNVKYKAPARAGMRLAVSAEVSRLRGEKRYIHVRISSLDTELFRAKFIMG